MCYNSPVSTHFFAALVDEQISNHLRVYFSLVGQFHINTLFTIAECCALF